MNFYFRSRRFKDTGLCVFYIPVYLQRLRIHSDVSNASHIWLYKYATRLDVSCDRTDYGNFTRWLGATYPAKQNKSNQRIGKETNFIIKSVTPIFLLLVYIFLYLIFVLF